MGKYFQRTKTDCGPAAFSAASDKPYEEVLNAFRWPKSDDMRNNLTDSPASHFLAAQRLNVPYQVVTAGMIIRGECQPDRTVILLHGDGLIGSYMAQHWVTLAYVKQINGVIHVGVNWGDNTIHQYNSDKFQERYAAGGPTATAYECYRQPAKQNNRWSWWAKLMAKLFGK